MVREIKPWSLTMNWPIFRHFWPFLDGMKIILCRNIFDHPPPLPKGGYGAKKMNWPSFSPFQTISGRKYFGVKVFLGVIVLDRWFDQVSCHFRSFPENFFRGAIFFSELQWAETTVQGNRLHGVMGLLSRVDWMNGLEWIPNPLDYY